MQEKRKLFSTNLKGAHARSLVNVFATECENGMDLVIEHYTWEWLCPHGVHPVPSSIYNFAASEQEFFANSLRSNSRRNVSLKR